MFLFLRRNFVEHFFQREIEILRSATSDSVKDFAVQFPVLNGRFFVVELGVVKMAGFLVFMSPEHEHRQTPNQESLWNGNSGTVVWPMVSFFLNEIFDRTYKFRPGNATEYVEVIFKPMFYFELLVLDPAAGPL